MGEDRARDAGMDAPRLRYINNGVVRDPSSTSGHLLFCDKTPFLKDENYRNSGEMTPQHIIAGKEVSR
jgi:hypothetical protein